MAAALGQHELPGSAPKGGLEILESLIEVGPPTLLGGKILAQDGFFVHEALNFRVQVLLDRLGKRAISS